MPQDCRTGIFHTFPDGETREIRVELLDEEMVDVYRKMSVARKLRLASEQTLFVRERLRQTILTERPELTAEEVRYAVARRMGGGTAG